MSSYAQARMTISSIFLFNGALMGAWATRIPEIKSTFAVDEGTLGLLLLVVAVGAILSFPFAGKWLDSKGAANVSYWISLIYAPTLFILAIMPNLPCLAVALFVFGAAHGAMDVAMNAWGAELEKQMAKPIMSSFHAMFSMGAGLGAASSYLAMQFSLSLSMHFLAVSILFAAPAISLAYKFRSETVKPRVTHDAQKAKAYGLPHKALILTGLVALCSAMGEGAVADWSAVFLVEISQLSKSTAALGYVYFSIAMVTLRLLGDYIVARLGSAKTVQLSGLTSAIGVFFVIVGSSLPLQLLGFAFMGAGYAIVIPQAFARAANDPSISPGAGIASIATFGYGGTLIGPVIIGWIAQLSSLIYSFMLLGAMALFIALASNAVHPVIKREQLNKRKQVAFE